MSESTETSPGGNGEGTSAEAPPDLAQLQGELDKFKDLAYRAAAELENYRRRAAKEREELTQSIKERLVSKMIPVIDGFELAAASIDKDVPEEMRKKYLDGFQAIGRQMLSTLEGFGLEHIVVPADAAFHPGEQEAVLTEDVPELKEPMVMQVLQKGYRLDGRLIRPARVKVGMPASAGHNEEVTNHG